MKGTPGGLLRKYFMSTAIIILVLMLPTSSGAITLETGEPEIKRSAMGFEGAVVKVHGRVDTGSDVIIKVVSPGQTVTYRTGAGPIVTGVINVKGLPEVYKILSSREISGLSKELKDIANVDGLFKNLAREARAYSREDGKDRPMLPEDEKKYVEMTIKDRMYRGAYGIYEQGIKSYMGEYSATIWLDGYTEGMEVTAYSISNGAVTDIASKKVEIPYSAFYGSPFDILLLSSISLCGGCFLVTSLREFKQDLRKNQKTV